MTRYLWAKPYDRNTASSIDTGLKGNFKYSPFFVNDHVIASTIITLTGSRRKDYIIAEKLTGIIHKPGETVWHHTWPVNKDDQCLMQLVAVRTHQKSFPHAGGCRNWQSKMNRRYVSATVSATKDNYEDYELDFKFNNSRIKYRYNKGLRSKMYRKNLKIFGLDAYGNIYFKNSRGLLYVWDHETNCLIPQSRWR